jgi:hypothetical protein
LSNQKINGQDHGLTQILGFLNELIQEIEKWKENEISPFKNFKIKVQM